MKGRTYRADGGPVEEGKKPSLGKKMLQSYTNEPNNVIDSAESDSKRFKKGGRVSAFIRGKMSEGMAMKDKKAKKDGGPCDGMKPHSRMDKKPRASGGRLARADGGALSTASKTSERPDFKGMRDVND
jgi:hypothetical protein